MPARKVPRTWAEQLADLDDPAPKDLDPEAHGEEFESSDDASDDDASNTVNGAREHYEVVGRSKFREPEQLVLGSEYTGSQISRGALEEELDDNTFAPRNGDRISTSQDEGSTDSDEDMEDQASDEGRDSGNEETFEGFQDDRFTPSRFDSLATRANGNSIETLDSVSQTSDEDMEAFGEGGNTRQNDSSEDDDQDMAADGISDSISDTSSTSSEAPSLNGASQHKQSAQRAQLRQMMAESQKAIISNISAATKADVAKGKAIKKQRSTFDSLLSTRIKLQKALTATNSLPNTTPSPEDTQAIQAAEHAALNLWNTITSLRHTLQPPSTPSPHPATPTTPLSALWTATHTPTTTSLPTHRATLTKWSQKIHPPGAALLASRTKFSQPPSSHQPLTAILDAHISGPQAQKHIAKARANNTTENIYDDSDFYAALLRELVEQRMGDAPLPGMKDRSAFRVKKRVDTKASKGRKLRYTVHEKLLNFMAPEEKGSWGERQRAELFGGLLGRRVEMGEEEESEDGEDGEDGREEEALRLFRR
ncbi:MAG: hypothetical protein Q9195_005715 [Heterodermia aff. obscurata]